MLDLTDSAFVNLSVTGVMGIKERHQGLLMRPLCLTQVRPFKKKITEDERVFFIKAINRLRIIILQLSGNSIGQLNALLNQFTTLFGKGQSIAKKLALQNCNVDVIFLTVIDYYSLNMPEDIGIQKWKEKRRC